MNNVNLFYAQSLYLILDRLDHAGYPLRKVLGSNDSIGLLIPMLLICKREEGGTGIRTVLFVKGYNFFVDSVVFVINIKVINFSNECFCR